MNLDSRTIPIYIFVRQTWTKSQMEIQGNIDSWNFTPCQNGNIKSFEL